ncbi:MAG: hypothetical protein QXW79_01110 [Thermoplasmata archaeon]
MNNFFIIIDSNQLGKIFENANDRLVVLMFYTKNNPESRRAKNAFEKCAMNHTLSCFCVVDMDKFRGESRYINGVNHIPKFDCYYMGQLIGTFTSSDEKEIEMMVCRGEQYIMTQNNMKHNSFSGHVFGGQQIHNQQIRQTHQIVQNPYLLDQMVQRQMDVQSVPLIHPANQEVPQSQLPIFPGKCQGINNLPTLEQMEQLIKLFKMMQEVGIFGTDTGKCESGKRTSNLVDGTIVLPTGDKLVPLPNGKYGLIRKSSN